MRPAQQRAICVIRFGEKKQRAIRAATYALPCGNSFAGGGAVHSIRSRHRAWALVHSPLPSPNSRQRSFAFHQTYVAFDISGTEHLERLLVGGSAAGSDGLLKTVKFN